MPVRRGSSRELCTVLFTGVAGSTALAAELGDRRWQRLLSRHNERLTRRVERCGGAVVDFAGDGAVATFDAPGNGVSAALAVVREMATLGLSVRAGVHTGEIERDAGQVAGIGVHIAARVCRLAAPGEVLVTSTVHDLVSGTDLGFRARGSHALRGVPRRWRLFAVEAPQPVRRGRPQPPPAAGPVPAAAAEISVVLVDDHPLWRQTVKSVLERGRLVKVVAEATDAPEALETVASHHPDVVIMDMHLPSSTGTEVTRALAATGSPARVLVLSSNEERETVVGALRAGACGYLSKTADAASIRDAVRRVHAGEVVVPPALAGAVLEALRALP